MFVTGSNFIYNSMQLQVKRQMKGGGLLNLAYTWSRAMTDASAYNETPMDSYSFKTERSLATYNRSHVFVFSYIYPLPFWTTGGEWYKKAFGGWQISGVTTIQTGLPLNLMITSDQAGIGQALTNQSSQRPNVVGDWSQDAGTLYRWFNPAAFALPAAGTFGNLGRNVIIGPGQNIWDASIQKFFNLSERARVQFRAEFYNAPNHLSWWTVGTTLGAANFGQITNATDPRTMQLGLRLTF